MIFSSWSGYYDELMLSSVLLYQATGDSSYLTKARQAYQDGNFASSQEKAWGLSWDDKRILAQVCIVISVQLIVQ